MTARLATRRAMAAASAAIVVALALVGCSPDKHVDVDVPPQADGKLAEATVEQLEDAVANAMEATGSSGAIVGVWAPWSGSWVAGLGTQNPVDGGKVSADMQFRAGVVTRAMTCDVLYAAAAEGKVKLNDPVATWVPSVPTLTDVTLEQLCDGTSGIGSYSKHLTPVWLSNPERRWSPRELASFGLGEPRSGEPGTAYRDSDAGYVLLGLALERALERSAAELIQDYVADPLDLEATQLALPSGSVLTGLYAPRMKDGKSNCAEPRDVSNVSITTGFTDSGVSSNITELGRYAQALATGALLPGKDDRFDDPVPAGVGAPSWFNMAGGAVLAGPLIGQFGAVPGYITAAFSDPSSGLTVAVVLNDSAANSGVGAQLAWELAAIASKAPAASGQTAPEAGLPWTAEQYHEKIAANAICAAPAQ
ncbi:beta-lactamase family protein [Microbacterium sp. CFH 31415]|uniref:serine hydrolase domain-containing protein n=1 Tax=Microbacterium sp. CFH 31415 TaxID=2921732 RepID=UPI001F136D27|nr:beta-lactamase family protein [Microbacterium sp. CFH 31415]MCH6230443.1 beta-lactamase family protein [Microbacterium sp. CFH 31415]